MPGMIDLMQKPPAMRRLEEWSRATNPAHLDAAITAMADPNTKLDVFAEDKGLYKKGGNAHLKKHWLSKKKGIAFWPDHEVAEIMRHALLAAFKLMKSTKKPLCFSWVSAPPRPKNKKLPKDPWEAYVWNDENVIHVLFYTPFVQCSTATTQNPDTWVFSAKPDGSINERHVVVPVEPPKPTPTP